MLLRSTSTLRLVHTQCVCHIAFAKTNIITNYHLSSCLRGVESHWTAQVPPPSCWKCFITFAFKITFILPPATKLWQGNVFTPVCQSFCSQGGVRACRHAPGYAPPRYSCPKADTTRSGQWAGGTHPTGMHCCCEWVFKVQSHLAFVMTKIRLLSTMSLYQFQSLSGNIS